MPPRGFDFVDKHVADGVPLSQITHETPLGRLCVPPAVVRARTGVNREVQPSTYFGGEGEKTCQRRKRNRADTTCSGRGQRCWVGGQSKMDPPMTVVVDR